MFNDIKDINDITVKNWYKLSLMKYGFCWITTGNNGDKILELTEIRDELEKFKDKKYLDKQIANIDKMIEQDEIINKLP